MKKSISIILTILGAGITAAQAQLVVTTVTNTIDNQQGEIRLLGAAGSTWSSFTNSPTNMTTFYGTLGAGEETTTKLARGIVKFDYSTSLVDATTNPLQNATLQLFVTKNNLSQSIPATLEIYGATNLLLGSYAATDFLSTAYDALITTNGADSTTLTNNWITFDVTSLVADALANASGGIATVGFRLQLNNDMIQPVGSPQPKIQFLDTSDFASATNGVGYNIPQLVISTGVVPEPATALLFGIGGIGAWILRRSKKMKSKEDLDA